MVRRPQERSEKTGHDGEWDAVLAARSRMMRDRVRDRAMRNPEVDALDYWAPGYRGLGPEPPAGRPPAP